MYFFVLIPLLNPNSSDWQALELARGLSIVQVKCACFKGLVTSSIFTQVSTYQKEQNKTNDFKSMYFLQILQI